MKKSVLASLLLLVTLAANAQTPTAATTAGTSTAPNPSQAAPANVSPAVNTTAGGPATASASPGGAATPAETTTAAPVQRSFASRPPIVIKSLTFKEKLIAAWESFCLKFTALMKSLNIFSVVGRIEKFVDSMTKQNGAAIAGAETGEWTVTKRRPATNATAKKVQDKLDKLQEEKLKKIDSVDTNY